MYGEVVASDRYYNGGDKYLQIDNCINITAVALLDEYSSVDDTYILNEDYVQAPMNETVKNSIVKRYGRFPVGIKNIKVTASFTMGTQVPDDITFLATYLISKFYQQQNTSNISQESIEGYSRTFKDIKINDETVKSILDTYTDTEVFL
jgi:hypothetical protein